MTLEELKAEFNRLVPDDQVEFARWVVWEEYEETEKQRKLSWLRHEVQKGIDSSNNGRNSRPLDEVFAELQASLRSRKAKPVRPTAARLRKAVAA
jgi:hypothetical protein